MRSLLTALLFIGAPLFAADSRPNIIFILMDDMGYNDIGVQTYPSAPNQHPNSGPSPKFELSNPDPDIPQPNKAFGLTPRIDSLASDGMMLTKFYTSSVCGPSRSTFMTGRYHKRTGIIANPSHTKQNGLNTDEVTLPEILREEGYATAMIGKWHLGYSRSSHNPFQYMPTRHGFQNFYGFPHSNDIVQHDLAQNETVLEADFDSATEQAEITWRFTEKALEHIQDFTAEDKPFFLYLAHSMTHQPCWPSDREFTNADGTTWPQFLGTSGVSQYYDVVKEVDHSTGRILDKLNELGISDNTIVVFTSDNGPWLTLSSINSGPRSVGSSYPLRGGKFLYWEGGVRVPFLVRWPDQIAGGASSSEPTGLVDMLPTFVSAAGGTLPTDRVIDGIDLNGLWAGTSGWTSPRSSFATFARNTGNLEAIVKDDWKLFGSRLYDLAGDIQETTDVASSQAAVVTDLQSERAAILTSIATDSNTYGYATSYEVQLSDNDLKVSEGGTKSLTIRLSANPGKTVLVNVAHYSGDTDLSVSTGSSLTFTTTNWNTPQTVTFSAAQDADDKSNGATFRVTTDDIQPVRELFVFEIDDEANPEAGASLVWPKINILETASLSTKLVAEGTLQVGAQIDPAGTTYEWLKISGSGVVTFSAPTANETGVSFSQSGLYQIRLRAEHPSASGFGTSDFTVHVAQSAAVSAAYKLTPELAYDANEDTNGDSTWANEVSAGVRDWTLESGVTSTSSDPAPQLSFLNTALNFPGSIGPTSAVSNDMNSYSNGNASFEFWFKPDTLPLSTPQVLWETGGDIGAGFVLEGSLLRFAVDDGGASAVNGAVAEATLVPAAAQNGFVHCVGVIDLANDEIRLFIDGTLADSEAIAGVSDWCGNSDSGLGVIVGTAQDDTTDTDIEQLGGNDQLGPIYERFSGEIAHMLFYNKILTTTEISDLVTGPRLNSAGLGAYKYGPILAYDANEDDNRNNLWENETAVGSRNWVMVDADRSVTDPAPLLSFIDASWNYTGSVDSSGATSNDLDTYSTSSASIELWFQPKSLPLSAPEILWETGGNTGASLTVEGSLLRFAVDQGSTPTGAIIQTTLSPSAAQNGFVHCVAVIDMSNQEIRLYIDGAEVDSAAIPSISDWCGNSDTGLGVIVGQTEDITNDSEQMGANNLLTGSYNPFRGLIGHFLFYNEALTSAEIIELSAGPRLTSTPINQAPSVSAGIDQSVTYTSGSTLSGSTNDDGLPLASSLTTLWKPAEITGNVIFTNSSSLNSQASFTLPGVQKLWLESHDSEIKVYDEINITVAGFTYSEWANTIPFAATQGGFNENPDGDAWTNGWEWLFGTDPLTSSSNPNGYSTETLLTNQDLLFTLEFPILRNRTPDLVIEGSENLLNDWSELTMILPEIQNLDSSSAIWKFEVELDSNSLPHYFIRARLNE